ncbi:hypothetical protein AQUCO_07700036v1 [Aquilegia coerulea]|uniref:Lipid desaturase domain-containing protein n=1 Tax=Aquilegia coerulea TaxID=218851 RepID=A0A2G5C853_AQUCA|nr:hypothetical protein AQUCO_07700036v1 [Aquilegia coerulea]
MGDQINLPIRQQHIMEDNITSAMDDDLSLLSTWPQRAWLLLGCTSVSISFAMSIIGAFNSNMWFKPILAGLFGYIFADLATGFFHWAVDNYGDVSTPFVGYIIGAFLNHHQRPSLTTKNQFANLNYPPAQGVFFILLPIDFACNSPIVHAFAGTFFGCIMFSLQFHAWAHTAKSRLPRVVVVLQGIGVLASPAKHALHHRPPYNNSYCMVSGVWNAFLNKLRVFEAMEMLLFYMFSVRPRSWNNT